MKKSSVKNNRQDVETLYKSLFDSDEIKKYIRRHVESYVKDLSDSETLELRQTLKVPPKKKLVDWIIDFMKDYCEKKIEKDDGAPRKSQGKKSQVKSQAKKSQARSQAKKSQAKSRAKKRSQGRSQARSQARSQPRSQARSLPKSPNFYSKNAHERLGLDSSRVYTLKELTQVYRKLSLKYHPDKSVRKNSKEIFQNIKEAYDTLKENVSTDDIEPKPSVTAGLLSLTSNKDDSKKTKGWTEFLKEKLLSYLPQIIVLGAKVSKKLMELAISALNVCSSNLITSSLCYTALFSLCTIVNSYNLQSLDWATYFKVYALQTLCQYVPMPFRLNRDKQKENRKNLTDDIMKKAAEQGLSAAAGRILNDYNKNPFANLRGTDMNQKKDLGDLLKGIGLKM